MGLLRRSLLLLVFCWALVPGPCARAVDADQLRALFVARIVKYVEWPADVQPKGKEPVVIAAADPRTLREQLRDVPGVRVVAWPARECRVLYFNSGSLREIKAVLDSLRGRAVLTVGSQDGFLAAGGMVNLREAGGRLRLEVAPQAARMVRLSFSSRLLSIADLYKGPHRPGEGPEQENPDALAPSREVGRVAQEGGS